MYWRRCWALLLILLGPSIITVAQESPRKLSKLRRIIREFSAIDENYIEPQHYNFTAMVQSTYTYDIYRLSSNNGQTITLSPDASLKVGPYFGWRWFFLGYTFQIKNLGFNSGELRKEFDFSIYSSQIGIDLYYRRTGSDYKIRDVSLGTEIDATRVEGAAFDGISVGITGVNIYYIFNHRKFSYPAAFSQSTCQKISCGSWICGIGYLSNSLDFDSDKFKQIISEKTNNDVVPIDSGLMFNSVKYYDINVSGGYAYNWVFAKRCLFCASAQLALSYKGARGVAGEKGDRNFNLDHFNLDGIGRFGIVYNNTKWYVGASAIIHSYNYRKERFATNNIFGSLNIYAGFNFGKKR